MRIMRKHTEHPVLSRDLTNVQLQFITKYTQGNYHPTLNPCQKICEDLEKIFPNTRKVVAPILIHNGKMEVNSHCVLTWRYKVGHKIETVIVDPTADQFDADDVELLTSQMSPWVYSEIQPGIFCSVNHMPACPDPCIITDQDALIHSSEEKYGLYRFIIM